MLSRWKIFNALLFLYAHSVSASEVCTAAGVCTKHDIVDDHVSMLQTHMTKSNVNVHGGNFDTEDQLDDDTDDSEDGMPELDVAFADKTAGEDSNWAQHLMNSVSAEEKDRTLRLVNSIAGTYYIHGMTTIVEYNQWYTSAQDGKGSSIGNATKEVGSLQKLYYDFAWGTNRMLGYMKSSNSAWAAVPNCSTDVTGVTACLKIAECIIEAEVDQKKLNASHQAAFVEAVDQSNQLWTVLASEQKIKIPDAVVITCPGDVDMIKEMHMGVGPDNKTNLMDVTTDLTSAVSVATLVRATVVEWERVLTVEQLDEENVYPIWQKFCEHMSCNSAAWHDVVDSLHDHALTLINLPIPARLIKEHILGIRNAERALVKRLPHSEFLQNMLTVDQPRGKGSMRYGTHFEAAGRELQVASALIATGHQKLGWSPWGAVASAVNALYNAFQCFGVAAGTLPKTYITSVQFGAAQWTMSIKPKIPWHARGGSLQWLQNMGRGGTTSCTTMSVDAAACVGLGAGITYTGSVLGLTGSAGLSYNTCTYETVFALKAGGASLTWWPNRDCFLGQSIGAYPRFWCSSSYTVGVTVSCLKLQVTPKFQRIVYSPPRRRRRWR